MSRSSTVIHARIGVPWPRSKGRASPGADGGGLAPEEFRSAVAEAVVATIGEFVGVAIEGAVAALHRLHAKGVAGAEGADPTAPVPHPLPKAHSQQQPIGFGHGAGSGHLAGAADRVGRRWW